MQLGGGDEPAGQPAGVAAAKLDGEGADPHRGEVGDIGVEQRALPGQGDARGQHEFAAAQQPGRVGQLDRVHPPHRRVQPVRPGHHPRPPAPHRLQREHLGHRRQHTASSRAPARTGEC